MFVVTVKTLIKRSLQSGKTYEASDVRTVDIVNHKTGKLMQYMVSFKVPKLRTGSRYTVFLPESANTDNGLHLYIRPEKRDFPVGLTTGTFNDPNRRVFAAEPAHVSSFLNGGKVLIRSFWGTSEAEEMRLALAINASPEMAQKSDYSALTEAFYAEIMYRLKKYEFVKVRLEQEIGLFAFRNEVVINTHKKLPAGTVVSILDPDLYACEETMKNGIDTFVSCMVTTNDQDDYYIVPLRNLEFTQEW